LSFVIFPVNRLRYFRWQIRAPELRMKFSQPNETSERHPRHRF
jgi:hypothetical protein